MAMPMSCSGSRLMSTTGVAANAAPSTAPWRAVCPRERPVPPVPAPAASTLWAAPGVAPITAAVTTASVTATSLVHAVALTTGVSSMPAIGMRM